ncbi:hypothetical protein [Bradyrhizobium tunisiense]|uniref:hypothetical protein n=1 Tax=Bradyrhizobium tunisiense TaxID=3278709 RepID=UPI0035E20153
METLIGNPIERVLAHKASTCAAEYKFRVFTSGQKQRITPKIVREVRRPSAVEPVIGHLKSEHRTGHDYLWRRKDAVLAAAATTFCG